MVSRQWIWEQERKEARIRMKAVEHQMETNESCIKCGLPLMPFEEELCCKCGG